MREFMEGTRSDVRLSVVIANYNGMGTLPAMLESLKAYPYRYEEIIVVDDGSTDGSAEWLRQNHPDHNGTAGQESGNAGVKGCFTRSARRLWPPQDRHVIRFHH